MPLPVGPLFGFRSLPLACCFVSIPLESEVKWAWLWKSWFWNRLSSLLPFSFLLFENKRPQNTTYWICYFVPNMDTGHYTRMSLSAFQKLFPVCACPGYHHFHLRERETEAEELVTCLVLPLWLKKYEYRNFQTYPKGERLVLLKPQKPIVLVWKLPSFTPCAHRCVCALSRLIVFDSCDLMDCSPPGSSVQARILEWVTMPFSGELQKSYMIDPIWSAL